MKRINKIHYIYILMALDPNLSQPCWLTRNHLILRLSFSRNEEPSPNIIDATTKNTDPYRCFSKQT